jgi:hypothetical protein
VNFKTYRQTSEEYIDIDVIISVLESIEVPKHREILVILDDFTRPYTIVHRLLLDVVLAKMDFDYGRLSVLFANGMHRAMTFSEIEHKIGKVHAKKCKVYQHNPHEVYSRFLVPISDYYRITLSTVMPHSFTGFSGGAKLIVPGLSSLRTASKFHSSPEAAWEMHQNVYGSEIIDVMVEVVLNSIGSPMWIRQGMPSRSAHNDAVNECERVSTIDLPQHVDIAVLEPQYKYHDFMQALNSLTVLQGYNCVSEGGLIAIWNDNKDGIGVHYLFGDQGRKQGFIDESSIFGPILDKRNIAFITHNCTVDQMQEFFFKPIEVFRTFDEFDLKYLDDDVNAILIEGADCSIGRCNVNV